MRCKFECENVLNAYSTGIRHGEFIHLLFENRKENFQRFDYAFAYHEPFGIIFSLFLLGQIHLKRRIGTSNEPNKREKSGLNLNLWFVHCSRTYT